MESGKYSNFTAKHLTTMEWRRLKTCYLVLDGPIVFVLMIGGTSDNSDCVFVQREEAVGLRGIKLSEHIVNILKMVFKGTGGLC